ncbi:hypothetical protein [Bacillus safensis]
MNINDPVPYLDRLDHQIARFGFQVEAVALDSGYLTTPICKGISDRRILDLRNGNSIMIPNMIITYFQMVRSYYIQQLIEKVIGSTNQTLKNAYRVLSLRAVQDQKIIKSDLKTCMGGT